MRLCFQIGMALVFIGGSLNLALAQASMLEYEACFRNSPKTPADTDRLIFACSRIIGDATLPEDIRAKAYTRRGAIYVFKDRKRALADYDEAIRLDPKNVVAHIHRALAYEPNNDRVSDGLNEAIRINPGMAADAYVLRAIGSYAKNDYDRALEDLNEAIRLGPSQDRAVYPGIVGSLRLVAYMLRGKVFARKGDRDRAIADLRKAHS